MARQFSYSKSSTTSQMSYCLRLNATNITFYSHIVNVYACQVSFCQIFLRCKSVIFRILHFWVLLLGQQRRSNICILHTFFLRNKTILHSLFKCRIVFSVVLYVYVGLHNQRLCKYLWWRFVRTLLFVFTLKCRKLLFVPFAKRFCFGFANRKSKQLFI